jgi:Tfp pilus assembly protein PilN
LLGLLTAELEQTGHAMDFLHPRRAPAPPSLRKKYILAGIAATVLLVGWFVYARVEQSQLAAEVSRLSQESRALEAAAAKADKVQASVKEITKWTDGDVAWLDQLRALSEDFPPAEDAVLTQLTLTSTASGGEMRLKGLAKKADTIAAMEERLRNRSRRVIGRDSREDSSLPPYRWRFETSVFPVRDLP